jgi:hypothetical protein
MPVSGPGAGEPGAGQAAPPMAARRDAPRLDLEEDLEFQQRSWQIQRVGWALMALATLAALLGLFGSGPLSRATAGREPDGLQVEYARFTRVSAPGTLRIRVPARAGADGFSLSLSRVYLEQMRVESVLPVPTAIEARPDDILYVFAARQAPESIWVTFRIQPDAAGVVRARVGMPGGPSLAWWQLVYP